MGDVGRYKRVTWGKPGQRATHSRTAPSNWKQPLKWDRDAKAAGTHPFVFCASLADVFDKDADPQWRRDLFDLIWRTPNLTWLLLTKRPGMIQKLHAEAYEKTGHSMKFPDKFWPPNAAIGCTVVSQEEADRDVPLLLRAKGALNPAFAFLSMEPLLGAVDLTRISLGRSRIDTVVPEWSGIEEVHFTLNALTGAPKTGIPGLDWVITGGETDQGGHKARPSAVEWFRSLMHQCMAAGVAYHHKQNGEWGPIDDFDGGGQPVFRLGKNRTGRALDGLVYDARPTVRA